MRYEILDVSISIKDIKTQVARHRRIISTKGEDKEVICASVLVPIILVNDELHLLLTVRTHEVETHKGQISFPGGMCDEADINETETALREAGEEIGLPKSSVEILGLLDDFITPTGFMITPVVGYIHSLPQLKPNPDEVAEILTVPLSFFSDKQNGRTEERTINGKQLTVWFFTFQHHVIWGATAGIIKHFHNIIEDKP